MLRLRRLVAVGVALIVGAGCQTVPDAGGRAPLPPPPPDPHYSDYEPENPYKPAGEGVAERSVFSASSGKGYGVEVLDFLVSLTKPEALVPLRGAALLEVQQGSGEAKVGERTFALRPGTIFTVNQGERLHVTARGGPLALRTWIVKPGAES